MRREDHWRPYHQEQFRLALQLAKTEGIRVLVDSDFTGYTKVRVIASYDLSTEEIQKTLSILSLGYINKQIRVYHQFIESELG